MSTGSDSNLALVWSGQRCGQKMVAPPDVPMMSRETQAVARAVGWGGVPWRLKVSPFV